MEEGEQVHPLLGQLGHRHGHRAAVPSGDAENAFPGEPVAGPGAPGVGEVEALGHQVVGLHEGTAPAVEELLQEEVLLLR